jgi:DNA repair photolyase
MTDLRWRLADEEVGGQALLFDADTALDPDRSTGSLSGLEFMHVMAKKIINGVPNTSSMPFNWTINAYRGCSHACTYCFARPTHDYLGLGIGEDFDRKIVVKINAVEKLRAELRAPTWRGDPIAMGTNTDPYQRCEGKYRLTRGIIEALTERANPFSILTKSALILRDLDLLKRAAEVTDVHVAFSIGTLDERIWRATEPGTPNPRRRVDAVQAITAAGIPVSVLIAPILPGLSDSKAQLREVVRAVVDAGATSVTALALHLRPGVREHFMSWLVEFDPELHTRYESRYAGGAYIDREYREWLSGTVRTFARHAGLEQKPRVR